jgi:hypothetical protein
LGTAATGLRGGRGGGAPSGGIPAPDLSEEKAIRRAIEESELLELGHWVGLGAQLQASLCTSRAAPTPATANSSTASARARVSSRLGPRRLGVATTCASHSGELRALGLHQSLDASPATATGSGVGSPKGDQGCRWCPGHFPGTRRRTSTSPGMMKTTSRRCGAGSPSSRDFLISNFIYTFIFHPICNMFYQ